MNSQNSMTGLYSATQTDNDWDVEFLPDGTLPIVTVSGGYKLQRVVGISGGGSDNAIDTASSIAPLISQAPGGNSKLSKFDLHFTGISKKSAYGGLRNYSLAKKPLTNTELYGSAQMLAYTMAKARKFEGMNWVAEQGGSAILTQAMRILVDQGVKLEGHSAYLYRPQSAPLEAIQLAHQLGIKLDRRFAHTLPLDIIGNRDRLKVISERRKNEPGYKRSFAAFDAINAIGPAVGALTAAAIAVGPGAAIPALLSISVVLGKATTAIKTADIAIKQVDPRFHHKHIGRHK